MRWRHTGKPEWRERSGRIRLGPTEIKRAYVAPDGKLFCLTPAYGPVFTYDPATRLVATLGRPLRSLYDALFWGGKWFLAGYPKAVMQYDVSLPWTLAASTADPYNSRVNPHRLNLAPDGVALYQVRLVKGEDGCVYVGGHHERLSVGSSLGWYDPRTGQTGGLRQPFLQYQICDLITIQGGAKIVFSSSGLDRDSDGRLFIFNVREKRLETSLIPVPRERSAGNLAEVEPGVVLGVIRGEKQSLTYKMDLNTGKMLFVKALPGEAFGTIHPTDRRLITGPDGQVWLYLDNTIARLNPADGLCERVVPAPPPGNFIFYQNDLYIFGSDFALRRISSMFSGSPKAAPE